MNVAFACRGELLEPNDESFRFVAPDGGTQISIGPRTVVESASRPAILIADTLRIWRGEKKYLLWCRLDYQDILNDPHHVEICVSVGFTDNPILTSPDIISGDSEFITYKPIGPQNSAS